MGRPSLCTPELVSTIGSRLGQGEPLTRICADIGICDDTVRNWMDGNADVCRDIARAREEGEQSIAFRLRATARGKTEDQGGESTGDTQRDKLIIETDLKLLAKFNPKKWGDRTTLAGDPDNPLITASDEHIDARLNALLEKITVEGVPDA